MDAPLFDRINLDELQNGNLVQDLRNGDWLTVTQLGAGGFVATPFLPPHAPARPGGREFGPIPLSEYALEKVGFARTLGQPDSPMQQQSYDGKHLFVWEQGKGLQHRTLSGQLIRAYPETNSLHRFQNLYQELTGEALSVPDGPAGK